MPFCISKRTLSVVLKPEQGFILPVVLGVGVVMILLGVMMIERSSQNRVAAIALKANARSTAAAEHGVTQIQALLNRYRPLAIACSDSNVDPTLSPSSCKSIRSWKDIPNAELDRCSTDATQPITQIQSYANKNWQNSTPDPADGQFQLVSYEFQPTPANADVGIAALVVDGRINPDDAARTATTQLKVNFKVTRDPGLNTPPGLWIQDNQTSTAATTVQILTNVRDSTCASATNAVQQIQGQIQAPNVFQPTPGLAFPELPLAGTTPTSANLIDALEHPTNALLSSISPPSGTVLTYRIKTNKNGQSINLTAASDVFKIDAGANTVVLDLEGGLKLQDGGRIQVGANTTLIVYVHGPLTLEGNATNAAIEQEGTPAANRVQLYAYPPPATSTNPTPTPYPITLKGSAKPLYLALFAPNAKVTSEAKVQGAIWAKSWEGQASAAIAQSPILLSDLKLLWPSHISPITAWQVNPQ
jgi:Tfp pilus assembly protein PilX